MFCRTGDLTQTLEFHQIDATKRTIERFCRTLPIPRNTTESKYPRIRREGQISVLQVVSFEIELFQFLRLAKTWLLDEVVLQQMDSLLWSDSCNMRLELGISQVSWTLESLSTKSFVQRDWRAHMLGNMLIFFQSWCNCIMPSHSCWGMNHQDSGTGYIVQEFFRFPGLVHQGCRMNIWLHMTP